MQCVNMTITQNLGMDCIFFTIRWFLLLLLESSLWLYFFEYIVTKFAGYMMPWMNRNPWKNQIDVINGLVLILFAKSRVPFVMNRPIDRKKRSIYQYYHSSHVCKITTPSPAPILMHHTLDQFYRKMICLLEVLDISLACRVFDLVHMMLENITNGASIVFKVLQQIACICRPGNAKILSADI